VTMRRAALETGKGEVREGEIYGRHWRGIGNICRDVVMGYGYNTRKGAGTRRDRGKTKIHEDEDQCLHFYV